MKTYEELNRAPVEGEEIKVLLLRSAALGNKYIGALNKTGNVKYVDEWETNNFLTDVICEIDNEDFFFTLDEIGPINQ